MPLITLLFLDSKFIVMAHLLQFREGLVLFVYIVHNAYSGHNLLITANSYSHM